MKKQRNIKLSIEAEKSKHVAKEKADRDKLLKGMEGDESAAESARGDEM